MSQLPALDSVIHPVARLRLCALLAPVDTLEFSRARDAIGISDSVLSKHVRALAEAKYVHIEKRTERGRKRTWLTLTPAGKSAFTGHVAELRRLASASLEPAPGPPSG